MRYYTYKLQDRELPIFAKAPGSSAFVIGEEGQNILEIVSPRRVILPLAQYGTSLPYPTTGPKMACVQFKAMLRERIKALEEQVKSGQNYADQVVSPDKAPDLMIIAIKQLPLIDTDSLNPSGSVEWSMICGIGCIKAVPGPVWDASLKTCRVLRASDAKLDPHWKGDHQAEVDLAEALFGRISKRDGDGEN